MNKKSFHESYSSKPDLIDSDAINPDSVSVNTTPNLENNRRFLTTETSPRIISMLRFSIKDNNLEKIQDLSSDWPFLTLQELVDFSETGLIECLNIEQLENYLNSWNGIPLNNTQAEKALTNQRMNSQEAVSDNIFTLIPFSVKPNQEGNSTYEFDGSDRYLLLHYDEEVLSPGEPTSTRIWLNALLKYYNFDGLKVAEVFSGSGPAAVIAGIGGAKQTDCYENNPRANEVARKNYRSYGINGRVYDSDVWSAASKIFPSPKYDLVLANPPFNPKPVGETMGERLIEAVQDRSYLALSSFLKELPNYLSVNGKAVVLYENLPISGLINPLEESTEDKKNAIELILDSLNKNEDFAFKFETKEKLRLRRFRGKDQPLTTYVVLEISCKPKKLTLETIKDHLIEISADELLLPMDMSEDDSHLDLKITREKGEGYPDRFPVPDDKISWETDFSEYDPQDYTAPVVLKNDRTKTEKGWADQQDYQSYSDLLVSKPRDAYEEFKLDENQRPLNPKGRTGIKGRGLLGNWGPNNAVDPILTRFDSNGYMRVLVIKRKDASTREGANQDERAFPGGMVDPGEKISQALARELKEESGAEINFENSTIVHRGFVNDPRNTDNSWMVTEAYHKHLDEEISISPGDDADEANWVIVNEKLLNNMYANHKDFLIIAIKNWQEQTGMVLRKDGRVGQLANKID